MGSFMHKGSVSGWEPHWTADSNFILRKIGQQLIAYSRAEPTKVAYQQKVEGMTRAAVAPGRPPYKEPVDSDYSWTFTVTEVTSPSQ